MNRPTDGRPCWTVHVIVYGHEGRTSGQRYYLGKPAWADRIVTEGENMNGFFNLMFVEPFLDELEAIRAAIMCEGYLVKWVPAPPPSQNYVEASCERRDR